MDFNNGFWKVCEALDSCLRIELIKHLIEIETTEFPCVNELAEHFDVTSAAMSVHLKKLASVGLVSMKRADRRVYYRAFPTNDAAKRVIESLRDLFSLRVEEERLIHYCKYAHALSHSRRHELVRCLANEPGLSVAELSLRLEMPPQTADRLWGDLAKAQILDLNGAVIIPQEIPERILLKLTLA